MAARCGVGVGIGATEGAGGGVSAGTVCSFPDFFPVVRFGEDLRGAGVLLGCAIELPSLLKKSPIGLPATATSPPARTAAADKIKIYRLPQKFIPSILHYAAQCSIFPLSW